MAVDEQLSAYSTTAASNTPQGTNPVGPDLDNQLRDIKKNMRKAAQHFKGQATDGRFAGAINIDDSASPTWSVDIIGPTGNRIPFLNVDASAGTSEALVGGAAASTFTKDHYSEATADARTTIMGAFLASVASEASTASASHALAAAGIGSPIGTVETTIGSTAPDGWLLLNGDTMGNLSASATHAGTIFQLLYIKIWQSTDNAEVPVEGGRGATATADWSANKNLTLPDGRGRALIGAGTGSGLTARTLADTGGEETHTLTISEMPLHGHPWSFANYASGGDMDSDTSGGFQLQDAPPTVTRGPYTGAPSTNNAQTIGGEGSGEAHSSMQPWIAFNMIIKY